MVIYNCDIFFLLYIKKTQNAIGRGYKTMKEKIYVEIAGIRLGIVTEEGSEYVEGVAHAVEDKIKAMTRSQRNCSLVEAALFCAMNYYSGATEGEKKIKNLETQIALYQANVNRLKKENEELRVKLAQNGK